jgi:hypothetical protein
VVKQPAQHTASAVAVQTCLAAVALAPLEAWLLMLVVGALHGLAAGVPAIGYGTALLLTLGADLAAVQVRKFRRK